MVVIFEYCFCRQRLEDMRRLYNADIIDATTPDKPFANISSMINAMIPPIEDDSGDANMNESGNGATNG